MSATIEPPSESDAINERWRQDYNAETRRTRRPPSATEPPIDSRAYEPCAYCSGSGLVMHLTGAHDCPECKGDCLVRARDERGRFTSGR